jgi:hypothetical protein
MKGMKEQAVLVRTNRLLRSDTTGTAWKTTPQTILIFFHVFVAAGKFLPSSCLATTEAYTYRHTDWREGFMKYAIEMGSGVMIYIPSFIKIGSRIQKLIGNMVIS